MSIGVSRGEMLGRQVLAGDRRALARLLTIIENEKAGAEEALTLLYPHTGRARIIGITGAPGTGKSTLASALTRALRARGMRVAILAVDPSSPFTGGAILGDRIRMRDLAGDEGIFIRSMATRGSLGGLARATRDAVRALDAAGFDTILIETVGAGQNEVAIARAAQTTVVVEAPGLGDEVQAIKAGILEIADVLVVNKADRPGADHAVRALRAMLDLGHPPTRERMTRHHGRLMPTAPVSTPSENGDPTLWIPPVVTTVATEGAGIEALVAAIDAHQEHLQTTGTTLEREQIAIELQERLRERLLADLLAKLDDASIDVVIEQVRKRELDPARAIEALLIQAKAASDSEKPAALRDPINQ
ncbi:MAG: methylmalonyl Co-A mutase-associated GTPase MeaB [Aggregatilineales bacterium]